MTNESWDAFASGLFYVKADFRSVEAFEGLRDRIDTVDQERRTGGNRLFYLATPPSYYEPIIENLGAVGAATRQEIYSTERRVGTASSSKNHSATICKAPAR